MTRKQKRLSVIGGLAVVLALSATLVLTALRDQVVFFYSPSEIAEQGVEPGVAIRIGGLVADGSWSLDGEVNAFTVTDGQTAIPARYEGILPDLFREGQGVVAEGALLPDGSFLASNVLAKHDENYLPREVADTLRTQGVWQGEGDGESVGYGPDGGSQP
ncbi:cytochrome c maturation protein CcmE [Pelagibacterium montanilacus]|uniref:cytochrome c maturation protein CcmE n=1 Tax=Pelagibacterium montanilacus TaxID=2185280 RepID=UPI000F8F5D11|nr:cytochrome c maturation protein CcmE [Pelagibacterium montanilacus]